VVLVLLQGALTPGEPEARHAATPPSSLPSTHRYAGDTARSWAPCPP